MGTKYEWKDIKTFDQSRKKGNVYLKSPHYNKVKITPCHLVKVAHLATEWSEIK